MDRVPNVWIKEFCGMKKGLDERIDEGVLRWFGNVERMEKNRISKSLCRSMLVVAQWVGHRRDGLIA